MKKFAIQFLVLLVVILAVALNSDVEPRTKAQEFYHDGLSNFSTECLNLKRISEQYVGGKKKHQDFSEQVESTRLAFKKIEVLAEYFDPQMISDKINGAPLPKIERKSPNLRIFPPKGLQRLDEIAADESEVQGEEFLKISKELYQSALQLEELQTKVKFYDRHIFEAVRTELLRSFSLGLTGFDAPGSLNSIAEAQNVFQSIDFLIGLYLDQIAEANQNLSVSMRNEIQSIRKRLNESEFEALDRLALLRNSILPLYEDILKAQQALGIELPHEVLRKPGAVNYTAKTFFDDDYLRTGYYSQIADQDNSPVLRKLGEYLFFDPILSENNQMSCASCHKPEMAFQDGLAKSKAGHEMGTVSRNAPTLLNAVYAKRYFHDMRAGRLQAQIEHVVFSEDEFNTSYQKIIDKILKSEEYVKHFDQAFPYITKDRISAYSVAQAVTAYVESLHSWNSPFDRYVRQESNELSEESKRGFNLFMGKANCGTCHFAPTFAGLVPPLFTDSESEVLGITTSFDTLNPKLDNDLGRYENGRLKEKAEFYQRSFKTVGIRNVELTAPYMHNGAFKSLEEVMHFYNKGGGEGLGLEVAHQTLGSDPLDLSRSEMNDIIEFMKSLTDTVGFVSRPNRLPAFSDKDLDSRIGRAEAY